MVPWVVMDQILLGGKGAMSESLEGGGCPGAGLTAELSARGSGAAAHVLSWL